MPVFAKLAIIDDDALFRLALNGLLRAEGYQVESFAGAEEFLASEECDGFDCVVSDVEMPGMSGLELCPRLTALGIDTPVILITARADPGLDHMAARSGAVALLYKPFAADDLIERLRTMLDG